MLVLVDEDVPQSVAEFLAGREHQTEFVREVLVPGSADILVARWADDHGAVVATCNLRHFRRLIARVPPDGYARFRHAGLLGIACPQPLAAARLEAHIQTIENEFAYCGGQHDTRMIVEVHHHRLQIVR